YPETKYVDSLVAPHTVNTMPMQTLLAASEHSEVTGATADQDPTADMQALADAGIDLDDVTAKLLDDGIKQFEVAMDGLRAFVEECLAEGFEDCVLCGMGGSSLGPEVIRRTFGDIEGAMRLHVLDSTDPAAVLDVERRVDLAKTVFIISSKSGGTIETLSRFRYFHQQVAAEVGDAQAGKHFVAVTDPGSPLVGLAHEHGFRRVFDHDPYIGQRY